MNIISLTITTIFFSIIIFIFSYFSMICYKYDYIIVMDNKKIVANVKGFHHTYINYYNYINTFMKSKNIIDSEYYSNGIHNPFETDIKYINMLT